jgi:hypothetical protein
MRKLLLASVVAFAGIAASTAQAQSVAWQCTFLSGAQSAGTGNLLGIIPILNQLVSIQIGPEDKVARGAMTCVSPLYPSVTYSDVMVATHIFRVAGNFLNPLSHSNSVSWKINAGASRHPAGMFGTFRVQGGAGVNLALVRLSASGGAEGAPGTMSGYAEGAVSNAASIGGDVQVGTIEVRNLKTLLNRPY